LDEDAGTIGRGAFNVPGAANAARDIPIPSVSVTNGREFVAFVSAVDRAAAVANFSLDALGRGYAENAREAAELAARQEQAGRTGRDAARSIEELDAALLALIQASQAAEAAEVERARTLEQRAAAGTLGRGLNPVAEPFAPFAPVANPFMDPTRQRGVLDDGKSAASKAAEIEATRRQAALVEQAGQQFQQAVIVAGAQFAASLVQSIKSGDIGGAFQSVLGLGGQVAGAAGSFLSSAGPTASLLGLTASAIPGLGLAAALLPIIGGIFGSLFSGIGQDRRTDSRAAGAQARQAPALELNFTFNQSLALASLTDPESRAALNQSATDAFDRFQRVLQTNVLPRLDRLEGRLA